MSITPIKLVSIIRKFFPRSAATENYPLLLSARFNCALYLGVLLCPLLCRLYRRVLVLLPPLRYIIGKRVIRVGSAQERLDGKEDGADLEGRRPVACIRISST